MPLSKMRDLLCQAQREGWAVPAFDVINHETVLAVIETAAAERAPVILLMYTHHTPPQHYRGLTALIEAEAERAGIPVSLQLDHADTMEQVRAALDAGFPGIMFDASQAPLEENIRLTRQVVDLAHARGADVEAELGHVGSGDEELSEAEAADRLTPVRDAVRFVQETGVDALAVAIGTAHGFYKAQPRLDFERLAALREALSVPLVLHGGSGTPEADVRRTVDGGICKVNIWAEVAFAFTKNLMEGLGPTPDQRRLYSSLTTAGAAAGEIVRAKIRLLGAAGRA